MSTTFVALLRGINVGGHNRVPMAELRQALTASGFNNVATYIQSGNIILDSVSGSDNEAAVVAAVHQVLADTFDLAIPVVARRAEEWPAVMAENPFPDRVGEPKMLHVYFCDSAPDPEDVERLDVEQYQPDEARSIDRHLYVYYRNGAARSKLTTNMLERHLGVTATGRNWSTVLKLNEMLLQREADG